MGFEQTVMRCGAPALCGIKPACLFSVRMPASGGSLEKIDEWNRSFSEDGIHIVPIRKDDDRILFFVYNRALLEECCGSRSALDYLRRKGYPVERGFDAVLSELLLRLFKCGEFPHEVGLFLGYPFGDVVQFERQAGRGFVYSGSWKVYSNKEAAVARMNLYKECREACLRLLCAGHSVPAAAVKYKSMLCEVKA